MPVGIIGLHKETRRTDVVETGQRDIATALANLVCDANLTLVFPLPLLDEVDSVPHEVAPPIYALPWPPSLVMPHHHLFEQ
eukprot:6490506-Amphidinium_carterae.5